MQHKTVFYHCTTSVFFLICLLLGNFFSISILIRFLYLQILSLSRLPHVPLRYQLLMTASVWHIFIFVIDALSSETFRLTFSKSWFLSYSYKTSIGRLCPSQYNMAWLKLYLVFVISMNSHKSSFFPLIYRKKKYIYTFILLKMFSFFILRLWQSASDKHSSFLQRLGDVKSLF